MPRNVCCCLFRNNLLAAIALGMIFAALHLFITGNIIQILADLAQLKAQVKETPGELQLTPVQQKTLFVGNLVLLIPSILSSLSYLCLVVGAWSKHATLIKIWMLINITTILTWFIHMVMNGAPIDLLVILPDMWMLLVGLGALSEVQEYEWGP